MRRLPGVKFPHVHLSFDDHSVSSWHAARELLSDYGAKAVFYVDSFHMLTEEELSMLSDLRDDGHVIGCHGKKHRDAIAYCRTFNINKYVDDEVLPAMEDMAGAGFEPSHFAFPYSHFDELLYTTVNSVFCYVRPGNESHYYSGRRMVLSPYRFSKDETPREARIRQGDLQGVLDGLKETAEMRRGISIIFHDIRPTGAQAHAGTHADAFVTPQELEAVLKALRAEGYAYETFAKACQYGDDPVDKPDSIV
jgi:peptidoglycan/xylan/chitin deacetylase (PgdA/CDA1 family)